MELRSSEEEIASLNDRFDWIQRQATLFGLELTTGTSSEETSNEKHENSTTDIKDCSHAKTTSKSTATELFEAIKDYINRMERLDPLIARFRKRIHEKDPVTDKPRYGTQTTRRVERLLQTYDKLAAFSIDCATVEDLAAQETKRQEEELRRKRQTEIEAKAAKEAMEEKAQNEAEAKRIEAERKIQAEKAVEFERLQREAREAAAADRAWARRIPKTQESVRTQFHRFRKTNGSIQALKTIFSQILSRPEDESCRRIRRDHPQFLYDIGDHAGGKEVLIAGGFDVGVVDEVPSFICKEPNVETDLDGWTAWYDRIKSTLHIIEEESQNKNIS